ncbi:MAG: sulfite exporter TauE/SafE family protein [Cytophagaceae bacterium]|nr:sulfite exporter TauE/SafE family protein [Gemmatimonadaceae bacterium]
MQDTTAAATAAASGADTAKLALLGALAVVTILYIIALVRGVMAQRAAGRAADTTPTPLGLGLGFVTNFFDTLGIGSFAPTTSAFRFLKSVPDEKIPGTLNVGHTLPTIAQTFIFTTIVPVESKTLILMIISAVAGSWIGAGVVSGLSRTKIQLGMGLALLTAALLMLSSLLGLTPSGGTALGVSGPMLFAGMAGNFVLGALMTLGIGLYAPCLILVSMLGMNVTAAFPIMMGSCAFLMPVASAKFIRTGGFDAKAALGLALGGIPAVLLAAYVVKSLPLNVLRWVVLVVILYTAYTLLMAARSAKRATA